MFDEFIHEYTPKKLYNKPYLLHTNVIRKVDIFLCHFRHYIS